MYKIFLFYITDVITFTGRVNVTAITKQEELMFNMMNKLFQDIRSVETDLTTIHSNISAELKSSLPYLEEVVVYGQRAQ